jgi:hypothetical protein
VADQLVDKVAARASGVAPLKVLLTVLAAPFWLVGAVAGLVWVALVWAWAALCVGASDARARFGAVRSLAADEAGDGGG